MLFTSLYRLILCSLTIGLTMLIGQPEVFAQPVVNLGPDTASCGALLLDAGNPGATYLWNTTDMTPTILASTSGTYWVEVTDVSGTTRDSIEIVIVEQPASPAVSDTNVCGPGLLTLSATSAADELLWFADSGDALPTYIGNPVQIPVSATTTWYTQANNHAGYDTTGIVNSTGSGLAYLSGVRGMTIDVEKASVLQSVTIFSNQPGSIRIELQNGLGAILDSVTYYVSATGIQKSTIPLYFDIPAGTGHKLVGTNTTGGYGVLFGAIAYPFEVSGLVSIVGSDLGATDRYNYFYDWVITQKVCESAKVPLTVTVLPSPEVSLGSDTALCGGSLSLDATFPGASYLWSTTEVTPSIVVSTPGTIWVASTIGSCTETDTIEVEFVDQPASPISNDTTICGASQLTLSASSPADELLWYSTDTARLPIFSGTSIQADVASTTTFYVGANNYAELDSVGILNFNGAGLAYLSGTRGSQFEVETPSVLKSVNVFTNQPSTIRIQLENSSGAILDSVTVFINQSGISKTEIPLFFDLPAGNGYRLMGVTSGGAFGVQFGTFAYPYQIPGVLSITGSDFGSTDRYNFFYDWVITQRVCSSPRTPLTVTILDAPEVELGPDTALCGGSLILDAVFPGASYVWSTGSTNSSISVSVADTYSVVSTIGSCSSTDTISVSFISEPPAPVVADSSVCGPGLYSFSTVSSANELLWYASDTARYPIATGVQPLLSLNATTTFYIEANNYAALDTTGLVGFNGSGLAYLTGLRGMLFDVSTPSVLKSVTLFSSQAGSIRIQLENSSGAILDSTTVVITESGNTKTEVQLFFDLPIGSDYRLVGTNVTGGFGVLFGSTAYPFELPGTLSITGTNLGSTDRYNYFFDWVITQKACPSPRSPLTITVLPSPDIELGADRAVCGSSFELDATYPGTSYNWSTGDTGPIITLTQSDTVFLEASIGSCAITDSVAIELVPEPMLPIANDTTVCGNGEVIFTTQSEADAFLWFASETSDHLVSESDSLSQFIQDTTTLFVESVNYASIASLGKINFNAATAGFQNNERGFQFDVFQPLTLKSIQVYADQASEVTILLEGPGGVPLDSVQTQIPGPLGKTVSLYFDLPPGNGYRLLGKNITGGNLGFHTTNVNYPYELGEDIRLTAAQNGSTTGYYYFYNWEITRKVCRSPRVPVTVTVALPLNLGPDLYACDEVSLDAQNPTASYLWSTGANSQSITVSESGQYWVELDDGQGCTSTDTIEVVIPILDLGEDGTLCGTQLFSGYDSSSVFLWSTGDTTPDLSLSGPGTYWVQVQEPLGCTLEDTIVISGFADFPTVELGPDFSSCDSATLDAGNPGLSFLWSTGDTSQSISVYASGEYEVEVTNEFSCTTTEGINVFVAQSPVAEFAYSVNGLTVFFENLSSLGTNFWTLGDGSTSNLISPIYTYPDTGTYTIQLIVVDILNNCGSDTFSVEITLTSTVGIEDLTASASISIFPNPTREQVSLQIEQAVPGAGRIKLTDLRGRMILGKTIQIQSSTHTELIDLPDLPAGVYQVHVLLGQRRYVRQLMIY